MPLIEIRGLSHVFPSSSGRDERFSGLHELSLDLNAGEFVVLAGPSGSGKTLLVRHLNGLLAPTAGSVFYAGAPLRTRLRDARLRIGMVFQDPDHQIIGQTVEEDIAFGPRNAGLEAREIARRVKAAAAAFGMSELLDRAPRTLSGGEKRRLALSGVFAMEPSLIVCDEPFSNLDFAAVTGVLEALVDAHRSGCGIVVVTHEIEKVLAHATRLVVLKNGFLRYDGPPEPALERFGEWGLVPVTRLFPSEGGRLLPHLTWMPPRGSR